MNKKRDRLEIIKDILRAINDKGQSVKPTHIMYRANLSHQMLNLYTNDLLKRKLIAEKFNKKNKKLPEEKRDVVALGGISLEVNKGEIFGLLGPNGAGKTTAIRCIAGILQPNSGKIYIKNQELTKAKAHEFRRDLGFLTENHGNYENLTLSENLQFFGSYYRIDNLEEKIDEFGYQAHEQAGKYLNSYNRHFSSQFIIFKTSIKYHLFLRFYSSF